MSKLTRGLLASTFVLATGCANFQRSPELADNVTGDISSQDDSTSAAQIEENEVSSEVVEENQTRPYRSSYGEVALDYNPKVEVWIKYFQGRGRPHMEKYLARSTRYLPMMKNVLRENGLPEDLVYISLIESGFSHGAHSHANAVGYWQFIRGTGKRYGLHMDQFIDERRDPVLSTRAAAAYFKTLYGLLGDWHLSMAAYNVGENRVKRVVTKYYTRNFWELIKNRRALPRETVHYVPKFIAAAMIAKDPAKYGFRDIEYSDPLTYDTVGLKSPISLSKLANNLGVDIEEMQLLNPKFRTDFVPISRGSETVVRIPVGKGIDALAALPLSVSKQPKVIYAEHYYYRVRRGDNLSVIAQRHRTTVSNLRRMNNLSNRSMLRIGRKLKVPDVGGTGVRTVAAESTGRRSNDRAAVRAVDNSSVDYHVVRRGDNLSVIAARYSISVGELLKLNNLSSRSVIRKGQKIRLRSEASSKSASSSSSNSRGRIDPLLKSRRAASRSRNGSRGYQVAGSSRRHTVRRGETLTHLSQKYGIALNRLARANGRGMNYRVIAGENLVIP